MRVVVTGAAGQVGQELFRCAWPEGTRVDFLSHHVLDVGNPAAVCEKIAPPLELVINAAAYTRVDAAENERELAYRVNAEGAGLLARRCAVLEIPLIHLSTDYIFDGSSNLPYVEEDEPSPLNVYGASKLAGEAAVRNTVRSHIILRTASVFGEFGGNFVKAMLHLGAERPTLGVVADQVSCPTAAADIAAAVVMLAKRIAGHNNDRVWGTYHFCGQPPVTWFHFAQQIFLMARDLGMTPPLLRPIRAAEYPGAAKRPAFSVLDCSKFVRTFGIEVPSWAARLPKVIGAIIGSRVST
jgi:dTDP-4-dehydrorhamnose reductase